MGSVLKKFQKQINKMEDRFNILQKHIKDTGEQIDVRDLLKEKTQQALLEFRKTKNKRKADRKKR